MADRTVGSVLVLASFIACAAAYSQTVKPQAAVSQRPASAPTALEPKEILRRESPAIVKVYNVDKSGKPVGFGTGFIVRSSGLIVTNFHVVSGAYDAQVKLQNGEIYENVLVQDYDVRHDVVLLKIRAVSLPVVTLGESAVVEQGDRAYAIGCPEGYDYTISDGLISAKRVMGGTEQLQISVPISHGSSGGPLYNIYGQVIGITTAGIMEGAQNLNFAVPLKYATVLIDSPPKNITLEQLTRTLPSKTEKAESSESDRAAPRSNSYTDPTGSLRLPILPGWQVAEPPPENMLVAFQKGDAASLLAYWIDARDVDDGFSKNKGMVSKVFGKLNEFSEKVVVNGRDGRRMRVQSFENSYKGRKRVVVVGALQNGNKLIGIMAMVADQAAFDDLEKILGGLEF